MNIKCLTLAASALAAFACTAVAQELVGITKMTPTVVVQQFSGNCAYKRCVPASFERQVVTHAGGYAYDSRIQGTWTTNGLLLANVDPWGGNCQYICKPVKIPLPPVSGTKMFATGLAFCDSGALNSTGAIGPGYLFVSYNNGYIARMDVSRCTVKPKFCKVTVPTGHTIAGLATDDVNRRLFIGMTSVVGGNLIFVSDLDKNWCQPLCKAQPTACSSTQSLGPLTGLAFDPCRQALYVTDGVFTTRYAVASKPSCQLKAAGCCKRTGDPFTGLCLLPRRDIHNVGKSCTIPKCEACPTMRAELAGDPVLGNPYFGLALRNAPNKTTTAILAAGIGACNPIGVGLGFCETIKIALPPITIFYAVAPITTAGCNRNITLPWQVPINQGLCGLKVSFQWLVVCQGNPTGHGVTNCIDFTFSGS